jgi:UDP-N-acetylglucosamine 2-epimerase (non-hydrolysing)
MKVMTILGTRPEIIRLSRVIPLLDQFSDHILVHTGQNYDFALNQIFFAELGLRQPDYLLDCKAETPMREIAKILSESETVIRNEKPDRLLLLGDTNSALTAFVAKRYGIPVYHLEAGNRCYDDRVPEEVNRRIIDHSSDILLPYTERSRANLLREGIPGERIYVAGNPIWEVLEYYQDRINASRALTRLDLKPHKFFLVTLHRAENVDRPERLLNFISAFERLSGCYSLPVICSLHPRTRSRLEALGKKITAPGLRTVEPLGLFDFIHLEQNALCVLSDSGTVQEEACLFKVPNVTLRDVTERPETIEAGSNILAGCEPEMILNAVKLVLGRETKWEAPREYLKDNVSEVVVKLMFGNIKITPINNL